MPAERRSFTAARPVKTERTHEENQERAYIAASRRSDRSLEARIESARRASEIHKKRTGRGLRVTEQDVINEEMYEEEDDDLPAQYQRLNAHLHTTSIQFNQKLQNYIATQHGVRNMFMSQYQNPPFVPYGTQFSPTSPSFSQANNWLNSQMLPPQPATTSAPQAFQQSALHSPVTAQSPGFRRAPYQIPQRTAHQRSFSLQLPDGTGFFDPSASQANARVTTPHDGVDRRSSLPPTAFEHPGLSAVSEGQARSSHSQSPPVLSPQSAASPNAVQLPNDVHTPTSFSYSPATFPVTTQMLNTTPLTLSLPPESQQLIGSALDPNDPRTAIFMSGSDNLPQPFTSNFAYDATFSKPTTTANASRVGMSAGSSQISSSDLNLESNPIHDTTSPATQASISEGFYAKDAFLTPGNGEYNAFFDFSSSEYVSPSQEQATNDQLDGSNFVNWD